MELHVKACEIRNGRPKRADPDALLKDEWTAYDVTKVSSEEIPYADCWCFGFPCFPRGTKITTEKGLKNIEDIIAEERVLTHENRLKKVLSTMYCNSQLYKQAGNSVTVNVTNVIAEKIGENV